MSRAKLRVASVLPSATEILCFIGGEHLLVGRSHEDNYPESVTSLPILTGQTTEYTTAGEVDRIVSESISKGLSLYTLDAELIKALKPDMILTQDICSVCAIDLQTVERLALAMQPQPKIVSLNPLNLDDVLSTILEVGDAVGMSTEARAAHSSLVKRIAEVDRLVAQRREQDADGRGPPRVAFIEWSDPLYVGGHWTPQLIERAGGLHPLNSGGQHGGGKSFPVPALSFVDLDPDIVIISPCGLNLEMTRREAAVLARTDWWQSLKAVQAGRVAIVDGDAMFNRPGPRLVDALEWLYSAINDVPEAAPAGFPAEWLPSIQPGGTSAPAPAALDAQVLADIEEMHMLACVEGRLQYTDPVTGYSVFSQLASTNRGHCCGSGCRHCVYGHVNVEPERKATLRPPITCDVRSCGH
jgi:ABC-type Fe3+-hydroxamate transport system substrate-binding protein